MTLVAVAGGNNDNRIAVVDFSVATSPTQVLATPDFTGGCVVDCAGTLAAAANLNGGQVSIFDISNPASPTLTGTDATVLGGIGAVSFDGSHVLAGELNGYRAALIDVSNPAAPTTVSMFTTALSGISSIALKGALAVASGPNDVFFVVLDYTNPSSPSQIQFVPGTDNVRFGGSVACDLDGTHAAVADISGGDVYLFDVSGAAPALLGQYSSDQSGVSSISISGDEVAAASSNDLTVTLIDFTDPANPSGADSNLGLGFGGTVKVAGAHLVAGAVAGFDLSLFAVAANAATALGTDHTTLGGILSVGLTTFTPVTAEPAITVTPATLAFGAVRIGSTSTALALTLTNSGTAPLHVTGLATSATEYHATPGGTLPALAPGHSTTVQVTFTPTAVQPYPATLHLATDDPAHPTVSVPLSGSGGLPQLVPPGPLDFGSVAVCLSHTLGASIGNSGTVPLHISAITTSGAGFSDSASSLTVQPGASSSIGVTFSPSAEGPASGTLAFLTDDPATPSVTIALSGAGTPEPPPTISVTPAAIDFGAVPLQYFAGIGLTVANVGPCEPLDVTVTVIGAAYLLTVGDPTTVPTSNPPISDTIAASAAQSYTVVFAPASAGAAAGMVTITSNDPANPSVSVPLTGNGVAVSPAAIELILDRSGSMATAITGGTRMTALHSAVDMFAQLIIPGTGFAMGTVQFDTNESVLTALADLDAAQQAAIVSDANALTPRALTSIGGGLRLGQTSLAASSMTRKVAIVFTDGYENTPPMIASVEPGVIGAGTEVYAVGLGDPAYLSTAALQGLAASSNGKFFQTTDPLVLRKQFVEVLADAFRQNMAADPILDLHQGVPLTVPVSITNCESRISFVLLWEDASAQIQFSVRAPDGTTFGSGASANNRLVRYVQRPGYRFFQIALPPGPARAIGPHQLGAWEMVIDPVFVSGGTTRASTSVVVDSELEIIAAVRATAVGAPMSVDVALTHAGAPISAADVKVALTSPLISLAQLSTPAVQYRAAAADAHHIPPQLQNLTETQVTQHEARFDKRMYVSELPEPQIDGVYRAEVTATGHACGGVFQRYWSASFYVPPRRKLK